MCSAGSRPPSGIPGRVRRAIEEFLANLERELGDFEAYLFGSYARGDWLEDSDVDIVVVSGALRGVPWHERYPRLRRLAPDDVPFEILAYTPEEFEEVRGRSVVLRDASTYWVRLR